MNSAETQDQYQEIARTAVELYASGADKQVIIGAIRNAKQTLTEHLYALSRATSVVDAIATAVDPDTQWQYDQAAGWVPTRRATSEVGRPSARKLRALELARTMTRESDSKRLKTRAIAERLKAEGDIAPLSDLATAVGNILSRTDGWTRVDSGVYEFTGDEVPGP